MSFLRFPGRSATTVISLLRTHPTLSTLPSTYLRNTSSLSPVSTAAAPSAISPYSQAIKVGNLARIRIWKHSPCLNHYGSGPGGIGEQTLRFKFSRIWKLSLRPQTVP